MKTSVYSIPSIFSEFIRSMRLSLPLIAAQFVYALSGFIATIMIAHLGRDELAANALVWSTFIALILLFIGILAAVSVLVAQSYGSKDPHGVEQAVTQGLILAILFAIPMMLSMWVAPKILYWSGQNPKIINLATPYFHSLAWCMLPLNLLVVIEQFLIGISRTRLVLFMSIIEVPIEILLFYIFIFGKWGMPKYGLPGIGYSFTIGISMLLVVVFLFLHFSPKLRKYHLFANGFKINRKFLFELIRIGLPIGGMYCVEVALFATLAFIMGHLGEDVLAAHQIAYQCFIFTLTVIFGLSQGTTVRVGHEVGQNNRQALRLAAYVNMGIGFCFMALLAILYIGFPQYVIAIDIDIHAAKYQKIVHYAATFLTIAGVLQLSDCFRLISVAGLRGLKDTKIPMYISMIAFWGIAFPSAYILTFVLHLGGAGIWWGLVIGLAIAAVILFIRFNRLAKRLDLTTLVTK